jgi:feruloyl esterase
MLCRPDFSVRISVLCLLTILIPFPVVAGDCEGLASTRIPRVTINAAETIGAGAFPLSNGRANANPNFKDLASFCRVTATLAPTSDSEIRIELWLPASGWNGSYQASGNGGWSGNISPNALAAGVRRGYATSMSDLGHQGSGAAFALGHPEKLADFGYRAAHEMAVAAKALTSRYYGKEPKFSYWNGCSAGGRSALMEAQRYPADFDGIVAGAPALNWTGRALLSVWIAQASHRDEASYIPPSKYPLIHKAVLDRCDAADGAKDGILEDPTRCPFDPAELECKGQDGPACLTSAQVATARAIYGPVINPRTGQAIAPGFERGSENGWATMGGPKIFDIGAELFRFVVFRNPDWNFRTFDFDTGPARTLEAEDGLLNAMNPDLKPFLDRGGKLIQYHGWSDPQIAPFTSVQYYRSVLDKLGGLSTVQNGYRLFMIPGMAHCGGGDGTSGFDMLTAVANWVEKGTPPDRVPASRIREGKVDRTRPLCPYPEVAKYKGTGSVDDAANFECGLP